jgi:hypothetical protein
MNTPILAADLDKFNSESRSRSESGVKVVSSR